MQDFLKKYKKIIYVLLAILCVIIGYVKNDWFLYPTAILLILLVLGVLKDDDKNDKE